MGIRLLAFLGELATRTRSLLATATPVQLDPIEAWDLLNVLAVGNDHVLGNAWSTWRRTGDALDQVMQHSALPTDDLDLWGWFRNPPPPGSEHRDFEIIRRALHLPDHCAIASGRAASRRGGKDS